MDPLKMYFLLNIGIFHCYVGLPEGNNSLPKVVVVMEFFTLRFTRIPICTVFFFCGALSPCGCFHPPKISKRWIWEIDQFKYSLSSKQWVSWRFFPRITYKKCHNPGLDWHPGRGPTPKVLRKHLLLVVNTCYCWWQPEIRRSPLKVGRFFPGFYRNFTSERWLDLGFLDHQQWLENWPWTKMLMEINSNLFSRYCSLSTPAIFRQREGFV